MNAQAPMPSRVKGWCPGALRPMETGDGLIVRVRLTGGILSIQRARALANGARRFGNGLIDLSNRANLQLRGVTPATLPAIQTVLAELELLDADAESEAVRNIIASPLAGVDPTLMMDVVAATTRLEDALRQARDLNALPGKFGFLIDGGGVLPLAGIETDLRFIAIAPGQVRIEAGGFVLGTCDEAEIPAEAVRLARWFLAERHPDERRMAAFMARLGPGESPAPGSRPRPTPEPVPLSLAAAPFGRLTADQLEALAQIAETAQVDLRLTPWRAIAIPARIPASTIEATGLIAGLDDPLLRIAACPGAPACRSGEAPTQVDARELAASLGPLLTEGVSLHVSGCPKGCARQAVATVSLTAEAGRYALAFNARAGDRRETEPLALADVAAMLRARLPALSPISEPADV